MKTAKSLVLTVTLNPAVDKFVESHGTISRPTGRIGKIYFSPGGKGVNVSRALKNLGRGSTATGFAGGRSGLWFTTQLRNERLPAVFFRIKGETRVNTTFVDTRDGKVTRDVQIGPRIAVAEIQEFRKHFRRLLAGKGYLVICGRIPAGVQNSFCAELLRLAKPQGLRTVIDTSGRPLVQALRAQPFLIKPNKAEAEAVIGRKLNSQRALCFAGKYFRRRGAQKVIISLGAQGAFADDGRTVLLARAPRQIKGHSVGCGDALLAGFIYADQKGMGFAESVRFAVAAGTANMLGRQPGQIKKKQVLDLAKKVKIKYW